MSARDARGRRSHFNMGPERSAIKMHMHNKTPANETHSPSAVRRMSDCHDPQFTHHVRSRSPSNKGDLRTRVPYPQSPEERLRSRGPSEIFSSSAGRFHSPGSVRHKFVRENHENQRFSDDRYMAHGPSPLSPHDGFDARYESCDPQSPISDRSPDYFTRQARFLNSPNTWRERADDHVDTSATERARGFTGTIDFNGLQGVPVGPRRGSSKIEVKNFGPDLESPYILIPSEHVPPLAHLTRHLHRMLKAQNPKGITVSEQGWHLYYDNSTNGRSKLKRCYHEFHKKHFFNYELNMQCFLDGADTGYKQRTRASLEGNGNHSPPRVSPKSSPKINRLVGREIAYPDPIWRSEATNTRDPPQQEDHDALKDTSSRVLQQDLARHLSADAYAQSASPVNANIFILSQRSERDDTASQGSGVTRSDSSRIKRDKCHVCSGETGHGFSSLVPCSTCKRRYHRRCHQDPVIPDGLGEGHAWSCRSCVKKGRTHKGSKQGKNIRPISSIGPVPSQSSPPTASLNPDAEKQQGIPDASAPPRAEAQEVSGVQVNAAQSGSKKARIATNCHVTARLDTEAALDIGGGDLAVSDPDDLVEKSFSAAANVSQTKPQYQKPGKFRMTRKKLPPPVQVLQNQQAQPEEPPSRVEPPKNSEHAQDASKHNFKESNTSVPAARNSVADLRALAHKAHETHQSAIRNGTRIGVEGSVESGGRQSHDTRSASTTRSSSTEQPIVHQEARKASGNAQSDAAASMAPTRMYQLEIPESPDEVRLSHMSRVEAARDPRLLAKHARVSSEPSAKHLSDASPVPSGKHTASKKSKGPLFSCCSACQKRIPAGPSGMARLCLGCKRKAPVTQASRAVDTNTDAYTTRQAIAATLMPADEQRITTYKEQEHVDSATSNTAGGGKEQSATALQPNDSIVQTSPEPPSATQAQPTRGGEADTATNTTRPIDKAAMTCPGVSLDAPLANQRHSLESATDPPVDNTSEHSNHSTHNALAGIPAASPERIEYIQSIVGDSHNRPKGSRTILVAMAMSMCPTRRMQAKDILDWISANIPTCKAGEGNWHERVVSQLTQGSRTKSGGGYWLMEEWKEGDGGVPGKKWYKLLPEKADEMWTWCPSRRQPVAPKRPSVTKTSSLKRQREPKSTDSATALRGSFLVSSASTSTTPLVTRPSIAINSTNGSDSSKKSSTTVARIPDQDAMDVEDSSNNNAFRVEDEQPSGSVAARGEGPQATPGIGHASSDDEPILKRRRREELAKPRIPRVEDIQQHTPANTEMEELPDAENEVARNTATEHRDSLDVGGSAEASDSLGPGKRAKVVILNMRKGSLSDSINKLAVRDQYITSFYNEWPEYREENTLDEQVKLAEIMKRPTRKQMFGKSALCSRLHVREPSEKAPAIPFNVSPEKRTRMFIDPDNPYPWEKDVGSTLEEFESLDEFFDIPANVIPIISEGQLAYRDGTRNGDGRLPRAREVFKP